MHKGQWRRALMFSLICPWINSWVNNHEAGDLKRHRFHYDVIAMFRVTSGAYLICSSQEYVREISTVYCIWSWCTRKSLLGYWNSSEKFKMLLNFIAAVEWICKISVWSHRYELQYYQMNFMGFKMRFKLLGGGWGANKHATILPVANVSEKVCTIRGG